MKSLFRFILFTAIALQFCTNASARYIQADPIGIDRDYSDPLMQVSMRMGIPVNRGASSNGPNHPYAYGNSNPILNYDPLGLAACGYGDSTLTCSCKTATRSAQLNCQAAGGVPLFPNLLNDEPECPPTIPDDPTQAPGEGWEWRGKGQPGSREGGWHNPNTGESLHDDRTHPPGKAPHVTYTDPNGKRWDNFGDGWKPQ